MKSLLILCLLAAGFAFAEDNFVSNVNSTVAALSASETFTGSGEDVRKWQSVVAAVKSDQAGTLYMEFSPDGTNWDSSISYGVVANTTDVHRLTITRPYYRARFVNATVDQTYMRLKSTYGSQTTLNSSLNSVIQADADAIVVRTISEESAIGKGLFSGSSYVNKFGSNSDVDAAEDIWSGGGDYTGFPASAELVEVVSSDTNDTAAGTGARTVKLFGLDANYGLQEETVSLNGTTPVDTINTYIRLNRAFVVTSGVATTNLGTLTLRQSTSTSNVFATIPAGTGQTQVTAYTIPAGYTGYLLDYQSSLLDSGTNSALLAIKYREFGGATRLIRQFSVSTTQDYFSSVHGGLRIPEKTDFIFRATQVDNANANITVKWDLLLVDN